MELSREYERTCLPAFISTVKSQVIGVWARPQRKCLLSKVTKYPRNFWPLLLVLQNLKRLILQLSSCFGVLFAMLVYLSLASDLAQVTSSEGRVIYVFLSYRTSFVCVPTPLCPGLYAVNGQSRHGPKTCQPVLSSSCPASSTVTINPLHPSIPSRDPRNKQTSLPPFPLTTSAIFIKLT